MTTNKVGRPQKFSAQEVIKKVKETGSILGAACLLDCTEATIRNYLKLSNCLYPSQKSSPLVDPKVLFPTTQSRQYSRRYLMKMHRIGHRTLTQSLYVHLKKLDLLPPDITYQFNFPVLKLIYFLTNPEWEEKFKSIIKNEETLASMFQMKITEVQYVQSMLTT